METKVVGNTLTITMELGEGKKSHSGKSTLVFSTKGFVVVEGTGLKISINVIGKK